MFGKNRKFVLVAALAAAMVLLLALTTVAFAGGETTDTKTACVDGYVINHRELPVDGSRVALEVVAVDKAGVAFATTAPVDKNGYFKFEKLPVGDWDFQLQLPDGWEGIVPMAERAGLAKTGLTAIAEKDKCQRIVFKIRRVYEVIVIKWEELQDGSVQPGEGWTITATPIKDLFVQAQHDDTAADGYVGFTLTAGKWLISETVKDGWTPVTPPKVIIDLDQYGPVGARDPVVFKNREPVCYSDIVVEKMGYGTDANGGQVLLGPIAGWKVTLERVGGGMTPVTKTTDGSGKVTFSGVKPGVYTVKEQEQVGWKSMDDTKQTVVHKDCELSTVRFSNLETQGKLMIHGKKLFKAWEAPYKGQLVGLSGWVITATLLGTDIKTAATTDALGNYTFTEQMLKDAGLRFPGATIEVCEEDRDNWIHVTPKCVNVTFPYPVPEDYAGVEVNFTNIQDPPASSAVVVGGSCQAYHKIAVGDTLARIAVRYGVSMSALVQANGIKNADVIYAGLNLCIP